MGVCRAIRIAFGNRAELAIDASGTIYLAYGENVDQGGTTVVKLNGDTWEVVGSRGFTDFWQYNMSLALDASGTPYIAYRDYGHGDRATVMNLCNECVPPTAILPEYCGETLAQLNSDITAEPVVNANKYKFRVSDGSTTNTVIRTDNVFRITMLPTYAYNTNYTIEVAAGINNNWGEYSTRCTVTTPGAPVSQLRDQDCNSTVSGFGTNLYANPVTLADSYRFRITNGATVQTIDHTTPSFRLNQLASYGYATTYTVDVAVSVNGVFGAYGPACTVTTPALPATQLNAASCGTFVESFSTNLYAIPVNLAQGYRFKVTNSTDMSVQVIEGIASYFRLNQLASYQYSRVYMVAVAVKIDGIYGAYGPECSIITPEQPLTQLRAQDCGITIASFGTNLYATTVALAEGYRFRVTHGATTDIVDRPNRNFRIKMLPSYTYNTTYSIEVAVLIDGVYGPYGAACEVSTPSSGMRQNMANEEAVHEVSAFPNPFETAFTLALETGSNEPVHIEAYDIMGKMLDNRTVSPEELSDLKIGENYAAGIYSVIVTQGSFTKAIKMVKK